MDQEPLNDTGPNYNELEGFPPDPIMEDDARLARAAALYQSHQEALRDVLEVLLARGKDFIAEHARPGQLLALQYERQMIRELWIQFAKYHAEHHKREQLKKDNKQS